MVQTPIKSEHKTLLTFEEYLFYDDGTDTRYELYKGKLIPMATPSGLHTQICEFLGYQFQQYFVKNNLNLVAKTSTGVRIQENTSRIPDVVICTPELWETVCQRKGAGVLDFEEIPNLVIEVTSENWRDDYIQKRAEYDLINIPEYWIVDPKNKRIRILNHSEDNLGYIHQDFLPGERLISQQFPDLVLEVSEILDPPLVEDLIREEQAKIQQLEKIAETERQRAETEHQRAEKLAALLREQGIDPDAI